MSEKVQERKYTRRNSNVDPRDFFDFSTPNIKSEAKTVDAYITPKTDYTGVADESNRLKDEAFKHMTSAQAFKAAGQALSDYHDLQKSQAHENRRRAAADQAMGNYAKNGNIFNLGIGYDEAYGDLEGKARGAAFQKEFNDRLKAQNYFTDTDNATGEKDKLYNELLEKHFGKDVSNSFVMAGAATHLNAAKAEGTAEQQGALFKQGMEKSYTNISFLMREMMTNPEMQKDPIALKANLDKLYETNAKPLGYYDRNKFTQLIISTYAEQAQAVALNPMLKETEKIEQLEKLRGVLHVPDAATGMSIANMKDTNGNLKFGGQVQAYDDFLHRTIEQTTRDEERKRVKKQNVIIGDIITRLSSIGDADDAIDQINAMQQELRDQIKAGVIDAAHGEHWLLGVTEKWKREGINIDDSAVSSAYLVQALNGEIDAKKILQLEDQRKISRSTARDLISAWKTERNRREAESRMDARELRHQQISTFRRSLGELFAPDASRPQDIKRQNEQAIAIQDQFTNDLVRGISPYQAYENIRKLPRVDSDVDVNGVPIPPTYKTYKELDSARDSGKLSRNQYILELGRISRSLDQELSDAKKGKKPEAPTKKGSAGLKNTDMPFDSFME